MIDLPSNIAVGADLAFPGVPGRRNAASSPAEPVGQPPGA